VLPVKVVRVLTRKAIIKDIIRVTIKDITKDIIKAIIKVTIKDTTRVTIKDITNQAIIHNPVIIPKVIIKAITNQAIILNHLITPKRLIMPRQHTTPRELTLRWGLPLSLLTFLNAAKSS
jgi:hypothetical protein